MCPEAEGEGERLKDTYKDAKGRKEGGREGGRACVPHLGLPISRRDSPDLLSDNVHLWPHDRHFGGIAGRDDDEGEKKGAEDQGHLGGGDEGGGRERRGRYVQRSHPSSWHHC
jgi:hypothetical protein